MSVDYAAMANAAIALYEATGDAGYLERRQRVSSTRSTAGISTSEATGHYLTASDSRDVPMRIRGDVDEAIPSATGQIIEAFARAATATGRPRSARPRLDDRRGGHGAHRATRPMARPASSMPAPFWRAAASWSWWTTRTELVAGRRSPAAPIPDPRRVDIACRSGREPIELPGGVHVSTQAGRRPGFASASCLPPIDRSAQSWSNALAPG